MKNNRPPESYLLLFVCLKVTLNLFAAPHFGFHRDELLHLALGNHLDWGYKEVPPFIALLAKISTIVFGNTVFAARIFPTLAGGLIIWFTGLIVFELGGKKFAIALACLTLIFSPAFAASDYLFQPVVFDQLWWVLSVYLILKYINTNNYKYLYRLGFVFGIGMLTKYTMAFFAGALILAILISKQRKILFGKQVFFAFLIAFILFLPNLIWQFSHHLPVITHMDTLQKQQLEHITASSFVKQQLTVNGIALFVWLVGFVFLFFSPLLKKFRFLAFAYCFIFIFLLEMNGKNYYIFGAYPMLFAAGGFAFEQLIKERHYALRTLIMAFFTLPNLFLLPLVLPVLPLQQTINAIRFYVKNVPPSRFAVIWEDQKQHPLTQDYADMLGWQEMVAQTSKIYHSLSPAEQLKTTIFADNYGEAGAFEEFGPAYHLPEVVCLNSSFALWAPEHLRPKNVIYISDDKDVSDLYPLVGSSKLMYQVSDPLAREFGTGIFLLKNVNPAIDKIYRQHLQETREK